jgi:hypothetical protein
MVKNFLNSLRGRTVCLTCNGERYLLSENGRLDLLRHLNSLHMSLNGLRQKCGQAETPDITDGELDNFIANDRKYYLRTYGESCKTCRGLGYLTKEMLESQKYSQRANP